MSSIDFKKLNRKFPAIRDLQKKFAEKIPFFAAEYVESGTSEEVVLDKNRNALDRVTFSPQFLKGKLMPNLETKIFNQTYRVPFGIAPVGLAGLIWANAEAILAKTASKYQFPFALSSMAAKTPEEIGPLVGENGWFQLYPPREAWVRKDILDRAKKSGFKVLLVTADVPAPGQRQRIARSGVSMPPKINWRVLNQILARPHWSLEMLKHGNPTLKTVEKYLDSSDLKKGIRFVRNQFGGTLDWDYLNAIREEWKGPVVLKGVFDIEDAEKAVRCGVDGIIVSNHGGRQFDGVGAAIDQLAFIADRVGTKVKIIFDSGIRSGLDILRAIALGADFVLMGRAFMYGIGALQKRGGDYTAELLINDLINNLHQLGCKNIPEVKQRLFGPSNCNR